MYSAFRVLSEQTEMNTSMVKEILHSLVERLETVGSGEIPVTPPGASPAPRIPEVDKAGDIPLDDDKPQIDYEAVGADEVEIGDTCNRKRKLDNAETKPKRRKKDGPSAMFKLRRKYALQRMRMPETWDQAVARCRREAAHLPPAVECVDQSTQANLPREIINFQLQALRSMTEQDKSYNRRSMSKAIRELSVYVTHRDYSDSVKVAVKILEFRLLLDQFDPPSGGLYKLLVPDVPAEILSRVVDRLQAVSEPGKNIFDMVFALEKLSNFIKDCDRTDSVEPVMNLMLRSYNIVTRKLSAMGNPDLRVCLDTEYKKILENIRRNCRHNDCTWYKEFCDFLGTNDLEKNLYVNVANRKCLLNSLCGGVAKRLLVSFSAPPRRGNSTWICVTITKRVEFMNRLLHIERVHRDYVAAEKTLAAQMTKLNPNWRIFLMDVQVNKNPNETADGVTIIDLSDD